VIIDDTDQRINFVLKRNPIFHGSQIVADVQFAGGLNAAKDEWHVANLRDQGVRLHETRRDI
jgi:hypothetical protein